MERFLDDGLKPRCVINGAEIYCAEKLASRIPATLKNIFADGLIWIVYDRNTKGYADEVEAELKGAGFKVNGGDIADADEVVEYARFVFGVGAGKVARSAKNIARKLDVDAALLLCAPSTDTILEGYGFRQVYLDSEILEACPRECVAAGWGIVLSEPLRRFEDYFAEKVLSEEPAQSAKLRELPADSDETALAIRLLEISALKNRKNDAAETMAVLMYESALHRGEKPRLMGEYRFMAAGVLSVFYTCFLSSPAIDTMLPQNHDAALERIEKAAGFKREKLINSFDFFDINRYFRINYILGEYRLDLLERLSGIDFHTAQRRWRRIYPDAGYWLKSALTARTLLNALSLASELSGGLLHYAGAAGFVEGFA